MSDLAYDQVAAAIATRDALDQGREHAPLVEADGALVIDSSDKSVAELVAEIVDLLP